MRKLNLVALFLLIAISPVQAVSAQAMDVTVTSPANGAVIQGMDVTINFTVSNMKIVPTNVPVSEAGKRPEVNKPGEGHLHFMLDLQPLVVWDKEGPYTFTNVPPGDHQLMVEATNTDHSPFSPRLVREIRFRTEVGLPTTGSAPFGTGPLLLAVVAVLAAAGGLTLRLRQR